MLNRLYALLICFFFLSFESSAQNKGVLPFTGIKYFNEGISAKTIEVKVEGASLVSNRLPLNKDFEIKLQSPAGFDTKTKAAFAAAELTIVSSKGTVLSTVPNLLSNNAAQGFPSNSFKELSIKLNLNAAIIKTEQTCTVKIRFFDLKGKNQLRMEFLVNITKAGEALQLSKTVNDVKIADPFEARSSNLKIKNIDVTVDTSIRVNPKMAYASLDITGIDGTSIAEVLSGKESYWVYDSDLNEVKMTDKQLKQVGGAMENNVVNYLSKIPYRLKTVSGKLFYVRFRWESSDKKKVIDVVVMK